MCNAGRRYQVVPDMTMTIASLQKALEEYPECYQRALKRQARAEAEVKRIKEEIELAEAEVDDGEEEIERQPVESTDYQKLKLRYDQKRAQLELKVRQEPMAYGLGTVKPTESTVYAVLNADEELCAMKEKLIVAEQKSREERIYGRVGFTHRESKTPEENSKLKAKLWKAEEESEDADIEVQVLQETLETYKMLTVILTGAKPLMNSIDL